MTADGLIQAFNYQRGYLGLLVDDVSPEKMTLQAGPVINHPAWQIGHLLWAVDNCVALTGGKPIVSEQWASLFKPGTSPTGELSAYPSKAELIKTLDERRETLIRQCAGLSQEAWQQSNPIPGLQAFPTLWHCMHFLMLTHESSHLGQIATWRYAQGMERALSTPAKKPQ